jgi:hypothetical protein
MAPLDQYLMERNAEVAMARGAAPQSISGDAEVMVLGRHGYETADTGKNGFVCVVQRSWIAPFDDPDFWNPKLRAPICLNPSAARSYLPLIIKRTELALTATIQRSDVRGSQGCCRQEGTADDGIRRDVLHAVKARVPERP